MFTLTHHTSPVNTGGSSEAERRELAARYRRRLAIPIAWTVVNGKKSIRAHELLGPIRAHRKRRSVQQAAVAIVMTTLIADGILPQDFMVIW